MIDFSGKTVLVTGGSRGIGAETAEVLGRCGARVVVHYSSNLEAAKTVAEKIYSEGNTQKVDLIPVDLGQPGAGRRLWRDTKAVAGKIDVLINNAGISPPAPFDDSDEAWDLAWTQTLAVNLLAVGDLCRMAVKDFAEQGGGIIVNVASRAAFRGESPDYMPYAASKGGMISMTRTLARGWAKQGVLAYAVAPGFVGTDMAYDIMNDADSREAVVRDIPMGDIAPVQDVANVIAFLASGLSPHATGTTIDVNGASYVR